MNVKRVLSIVVFVVSMSARSGVVLPSYDPYIHGATADILITVVDDCGVPVPMARVHASLATGPAEGTNCDGMTDEKGTFAVKGRTTGSVWIAVNKNGYYKSRVHPDIRGVSDDTARKERKWSDGVKRVEVVLKRIRNPKSLVRNGGVYSGIKYPEGECLKGFDLVEFDWCAPYGKGKYDDLQFKTEFWRSPDSWFKYYEKVTITMTNCLDGLYFADVDAASAYRYGYNANTNSLYKKELVFELDRRTGVPTRNVGLPEGKYIVFRTRTKVDERGRLVSANYGLITEKLRPFKDLDIECVYNPNANDTVIEGKWSHVLDPSDQ